MRIDWFTVVAQIVNFLILVWLLKRFLYGPVVAAMRKREERIEARLETAGRREQEAREEAERFHGEREALEREREALLDAARHEADEIRGRLKERARAEVAALRERWLRELDTEQDEILSGLTRQVTRQVVHATRRTLADLADAELEAEMARHFTRRLRALDKEEREALATALAGHEEVVVASALELDAPLREEIGEAVRKLLGADVRVRFTQAPELTCGLDLVAGSRRIGWNIADHLTGLEEDMQAALRPAFREA
jgi:F-type H+-transporting ATPase subunit b